MARHALPALHDLRLRYTQRHIADCTLFINHTKINIVVAAAGLLGNTLSVASLYTTTLY